MEEVDIFKWLIQCHYETNLKPQLPHIVNGVFTREIRLQESEENESYKGFLIIANGESLLEKLVKNGLVKRKDIDTPHSITGRVAFFDHLKKQKGNDGAYVIDRAKNEITRVYEIEKKPAMLKQITAYFSKGWNAILKVLGSSKAKDTLELEDRIPGDFVFYDGKPREKPLRSYIGTKTRLASDLTYSSGIEAFQIKRSKYTGLGFGKVTHFTSYGLAEEFFFMYNPDSEGPFIDDERKIVGVYRKYERSNGKLVRVVDRIVGLSEIYGHLSNSNGRPPTMKAEPAYTK